MNRCFYIAFIVFSILLSKNIYTQNLVPNPGFELHTLCTDPPPDESLQNCYNWFNALDQLSTTDWLSTCFPNGSFYFLPNSYYGNSFAHTGEAMVGFGVYSQITGKGESFGVRLIEPMQADSAYCFGFWIRNSVFHNYDYILNEFNVAFVSDTVGLEGTSSISNYQILSNNFENGWTYLSNYYIANGGEEYMLFGEFDPTPNFYMEPPIPQPGESKYLYYFVDDVSVIQCNKDSLLNVTFELPNVFTPNGDGDNDLYSIKQQNIKTLEVVVFNRWGEQITQYDGKTTQWNGKDAKGEEVSDGVYFVKAVAETTFGETLQKQQVVHVFTKYVP